MPGTDHFSVGAPCWADLWTSDVDGSRAFYSALFGWQAEEPSEEFGGYFMFTRGGAPIAGGMGDMGPDLTADDAWKIYLTTDDIAGVASRSEALGAEVRSPVVPVADLGGNMVLTDPTGATVGAWQPGTFPGFTALNEPGAPSWFELFTRDFTGALEFYRTVFHWKTQIEGDTDEFRYATLCHPETDEPLAGVMDASSFLPDGVPAHWSIYWDVADVDAAVATVVELGGAHVDGPKHTPYGRMATVTDPSGAQFKLRTPPV